MTAAQIVEHYGGRAGKCRCPAHDDRDPSLGVVERDGRVLVRCYSGCSQEDVIGALRADGVWPDVEHDAPRERSWKVRRPDGLHVEHMRVDKPDGKRVWWKPALRPLKVCDLSLYAVERVPRETHLLVVVEGEPAADALLADGVPAVGTVTGAAGCPGDRAMRELVACAPKRVVCWPDADDVGRRHMMRVQSALTRIAPNLRVDVLDPAALGLVSRGADAADWVPGEGTDVLTALCSASGTPRGRLGDAVGTPVGTSPDASPRRPQSGTEASPERNIVRIWRSWDEIDARPMTSPVILPGLAWEGESSILVGDSKSGKSTLLTQSLAAMARARDFLGSPTGAGRVAILEEMGAGRLKGWLQDRGVEAWSGIDFLEQCSYVALRGYLEERRPLLLVIDTLALFSTLNDADENGANDMRRLSLQCKASGASVLVVHHENRQGDYRGSSDIRAAVDMAISMKRGEGDLRTLAYLGRWPQQALTLRFTRPTLEYSIAEGDDRAVEMVNYVAENPGVTKHALRDAIGGRREAIYALVNEGVGDGVLVDVAGRLYIKGSDPGA